jgi:hypothetical protein
VNDEDKKSKIKPGERVIALSSEFTGGFAEEVIVSIKVYTLHMCHTYRDVFLRSTNWGI